MSCTLYLSGLKLRFRARPDYMQMQTNLSSDIRRMTVDWMVEVCEEFKFHREVLFLSVNYLDRFLSETPVLRETLQLVGTAAMIIAM